MKTRLLVSLLIPLLAFGFAACALLGGLDGQAAPTQAAGVVETLAFQMAQETHAAMPSPTPMPTATPLPTDAPTVEVDTAIPGPTATPLPLVEPVFTETSFPTLIPSPTDTLPPPPTSTPTLNPTQIAATQMAKVRTSYILALEDVSGNPDLKPRLDNAFEGLGLSDDYAVNTYDGYGDFEWWLTSSGVKWDLVIVSLENRGSTVLGGLVWNDIITHVENNGALIVETWYLDQISGGAMWPLIETCGIRFQKDWLRGDSYEVYSYVVYDLEISPVFTHPNIVDMPLVPNIYWPGDDVGDLVKLAPNSGATLLAGLYPGDKAGFGLLTSCYEGRVLIQTFSSHDYHYGDMDRLWQNYIVNTLANRFKANP